MKKTLSIFLFVLLSGSANAQDLSCQVNWQLTGKGFNLGNSQDTIKKNKDFIEITSSFEPSNILSVFGVHALQRSYLTNKKYQPILRKEIKLGKNNEENIWKTTDGKTWHRQLNGNIDKTIELNNDDLIIDSTIFPYLLMLEKIDINAKNLDVKVLTKGLPYGAKLSLEKMTGKDNLYKLIFSSQKNNGYVIIKENKQPLKFEFIDENGKFSGVVSSFRCQ